MLLATDTRNAAVDAVVDLVDVATPGSLIFNTVAPAEVATCNMAATAFGAAAGGTATAAAIVDDSDAAGGTVDHALLRDGNDKEILKLTCSAPAGGGDIELTSLVIGAGDTVSVTSLTITQPAS